jgi:uncharacterized membrane protein YsdA (DUF1294 family)
MDETAKGLLIWLGTVSLLTLLLFGLDKRKARKGLRRIPEAGLLLSALLGGAPGGLAGMLLFRHKIRKPLFRVLVPLFLAAQLALTVYAAFF